MRVDISAFVFLSQLFQYCLLSMFFIKHEGGRMYYNFDIKESGSP